MSSSTFEFELLPLAHAGEVVPCQRCGMKCLVAPTANAKARPFRHADGDGQCTPCIVADFLKNELGHAIATMDESVDIKDALRAPHIQEGFTQMLRVGCSELEGQEIDWEAVIAKWDLPLVKRTRKRRKQK